MQLITQTSVLHCVEKSIALEHVPYLPELVSIRPSERRIYITYHQPNGPDVDFSVPFHAEYDLRSAIEVGHDAATIFLPWFSHASLTKISDDRWRNALGARNPV